MAITRNPRGGGDPLEIARGHGLLLLEDAAHAVGGLWHGRSPGSIGDAGCFSFYATKSVVTGEGGMVTTDDAELARKVRTYAQHGLSEAVWRRSSGDGYRHLLASLPGFKFNMTDRKSVV